MNIAVSPLTILFLALPGILFRYFYRKGTQTNWRQNNFLTWRDSPEEIVWATVFAVCVHTVAMIILTKLNCLPGAGEFIVRLIIGKLDGDPMISKLTSYIPSMGLYVLATSALGCWAGIALHKFADYWFLDIRWPMVFHFSNNFDYMLNGRSNLLEVTKESFHVEKPSREQLQEVWKKTLLRFVYAVVQQGQVSYVYGGMLEHHEFNSNGELDQLVLITAFRFPLVAPIVKEGEKISIPEYTLANIREIPGYFDIEADRLVIQYKDVRTLALDYVLLDE